MKIGFDAKRALLNFTGLGVYSRNLINGFLKYYPENEYYLFSPKFRDELFEKLEGSFNTEFPERKLDRMLPSLWRSYSVSRRIEDLKLDVYHGLSNELPFNIHQLKRTKKVVTIHDLIFLKDINQYPLIDRVIYKSKVNYACKNADKIIAVSESTKVDIIETLGADENKISVVYQICDEVFQSEFSNDEKASVRKKYNLPHKIILNVSSFYPRKNQLTLIKAFDAIKNKIEHQLVLVGGHEMERKKINAYLATHNLSGRVKIVSDITTEELAVLYHLADLFVYPSKLEGFGIPILEAITCGTKVVASDIACFHEIGQDYIAYFDTNSEDDLAEVMLHEINNSKQNTSDLTQRSRFFSNENFCKKTFDIYNQL
jgi:glycosyltransferase involved in cell wall biosynthesis